MLPKLVGVSYPYGEQCSAYGCYELRKGIRHYCKAHQYKINIGQHVKNKKAYPNKDSYAQPDKIKLKVLP